MRRRWYPPKGTCANKHAWGEWSYSYLADKLGTRYRTCGVCNLSEIEDVDKALEDLRPDDYE